MCCLLGLVSLPLPPRELASDFLHYLHGELEVERTSHRIERLNESSDTPGFAHRLQPILRVLWDRRPGRDMSRVELGDPGRRNMDLHNAVQAFLHLVPFESNHLLELKHDEIHEENFQNVAFHRALLDRIPGKGEGVVFLRAEILELLLLLRANLGPFHDT